MGESEDWAVPHVARMEDAWRQVKSREIRVDMRMHLQGEMVQSLAEGARDLVFYPVSKGKLWRDDGSQKTRMVGALKVWDRQSVEVGRPGRARLY